MTLAERARAAHEALLADDQALAKLHTLRGWTRDAIAELGIGLEGNRVTIPIRDGNGETVNLLRYAPNPDTRNERTKMLAEDNCPRDLFPAPESLPPDRPIVLVEGEPDVITARSQGINAVGVPSAAGKPRPERFAGLTVEAVLMDMDPPGDRCANAWAQALSRKYRCGVLRAAWERPGDDLTAVYLRDRDGFQDAYSAALLRGTLVEPRRIIALPGSEFARTLKPRDEGDDLLGPLLRKNTRVGIAGFIGEGKTSLCFQMVAASAYGEQFFSYRGRGGDTRWLVIDLEQGESELDRRLRESGIAERNGNVCIAHLPDGLRIDQSADDLEALDELLSQGWDGVLLDPAYALLSSEPETEAAARQFATTLDRFHRLYNFCLLVPMHTRKPLPRQVLTLADVYGWSTLTRNTQVVLGVQIWEPWVSMFSILKDRTGDVGPKGKAWKVGYSHERLFHPLDEGKIPGQEEMAA